ncbi:MAG TPA: hypothetical protein VLD65_00285 [Anaerolineales bacterium]|nr:hypothetical protein [Anaerolineales bacterium]
MSILRHLSSQTGDRTEYSNRKVVVLCLDNPALLPDIAAGLKHQEAAIVGDCAEVLTHIAEYHPDWVAPFAADLIPLIRNMNTRVRWEAMHALALVATLTPEIIGPLLPQLEEMMHNDKSVIVRDYATDAIAGYATTGDAAAQAVFPMLKEMLTLWKGKQAGHALMGMIAVTKHLPEKHSELRHIAEEFSDFPRPVVRKAARALNKALETFSK